MTNPTAAELPAENRALKAQLMRIEHAARQDWSWEPFGCEHDAPKHKTLCGKCKTCWPCDVIKALDLATDAGEQP